MSFQVIRRGARVGWPNFIFIMGPGRSFSLRIGGDSSVVAGSGRTGCVSDRSAGVKLRDVPGAPPLPLDKGKGKVNLIKYPRESEYLRSAVQHALTMGPSKVGPSYGSPFPDVTSLPLAFGCGPLTFLPSMWSPCLRWCASLKWPSIIVFAFLCIPS